MGGGRLADPGTGSLKQTVIPRYNVGILASVLVHPGFVKQLGNPDAARKGIITAIYYLGTWLSYVFFSRAASDYLGRRYAALVGIAVTSVGTALQAGATGHGAFAMVIVGRIIAGGGVAIVSTSVPLYQRCVLRPPTDGPAEAAFHSCLC